MMHIHKCSNCDRRLKFNREIERLDCPMNDCEGRLDLMEGENKNIKNSPYLQITLDEIGSAPKVIYKGEEIKLKQEVVLHWETDTNILGGTTIEIEYAETGNQYPKSQRIEERIKSHIKF